MHSRGRGRMDDSRYQGDRSDYRNRDDQISGRRDDQYNPRQSDFASKAPSVFDRDGPPRRSPFNQNGDDRRGGNSYGRPSRVDDDEPSEYYRPAKFGGVDESGRRGQKPERLDSGYRELLHETVVGQRESENRRFNQRDEYGGRDRDHDRGSHRRNDFDESDARNSREPYSSRSNAPNNTRNNDQYRSNRPVYSERSRGYGEHDDRDRVPYQKKSFHRNEDDYQNDEYKGGPRGYQDEKRERSSFNRDDDARRRPSFDNERKHNNSSFDAPRRFGDGGNGGAGRYNDGGNFRERSDGNGGYDRERRHGNGGYDRDRRNESGGYDHQRRHENGGYDRDRVHNDRGYDRREMQDNGFNDRGGFSRSSGGRSFNNHGGFSKNVADSNWDRNDQQGYARNEEEKERAPRDWMPDMRDTDDAIDETCRNAKDLRIDEDQKLEVKNSDISTQLSTWENSGLDDIILRNIAKCGYTTVRPIQAAIIPQIMRGYDVMGQAETGGGKTAAFGLPIIHKILEIDERIRDEDATRMAPYALILAPTRELAKQIYESMCMYTRGTNIKVQLSYGEMDRRKCISDMQRGCHILVGTCGRIMDFVEKMEIGFSRMKFFVLDEADRLLDDLQRGSHLTTITENREFQKFASTLQTLLFSATFGKYVEQTAHRMMKAVPGFDEPVRVVLSQGRLNPRVHLHFFECNCVSDKNDKMYELITQPSENGRNPRTLVFVEQKKRTDFIAMELSRKGIKAQSINGDRPQNVREQTLEQFRRGGIDVLVGTDVCSRGLDIQDLDRVINYDLPKANWDMAADTFIHRVGRTGRLRRGDAYSLVNTSLQNDTQLIPTFIELAKSLNREDQLPEWMFQFSNQRPMSQSVPPTGGLRTTGFNTSATTGFAQAASSGFGKASTGFGKANTGFGASSSTSFGKTGFDDKDEEKKEENTENTEEEKKEEPKEESNSAEVEEEEW